MTAGLNRRQALAGAATVGIGLPVLAACGGGEDTATDAGGAAGGSGGGPLTSTGDIEVGGGRIFPNDQVVVTQPAAGEFKCFTAVCTHQGCIVSSVSGGEIHCDCHGSAYSIDDGSVLSPPATQPLAEKAITVKGDQITLT
jgi:Rieske Fe-S protein